MRPKGANHGVSQFMVKDQFMAAGQIIHRMTCKDELPLAGHELQPCCMNCPSGMICGLHRMIRVVGWRGRGLSQKGKAPKRRRWRMKRGGFEEVPRLAGVNSARESVGTTVCDRRTIYRRKGAVY